jgi:hypothetical protein
VEAVDGSGRIKVIERMCCRVWWRDCDGEYSGRGSVAEGAWQREHG